MVRASRRSGDHYPRTCVASEAGSGWPQFTEDEARNFLTRLGNQVLLRASTNSRAGNESFADKKEKLAEAPYVLTSMVGSVDEWILLLFRKGRSTWRNWR